MAWDEEWGEFDEFGEEGPAPANVYELMDQQLVDTHPGDLRGPKPQWDLSKDRELLPREQALTIREKALRVKLEQASERVEVARALSERMRDGAAAEQLRTGLGGDVGDML